MNASIIKNGSYLKGNDVLEKYWNNLLAGHSDSDITFKIIASFDFTGQEIDIKKLITEQ